MNRIFFTFLFCAVSFCHDALAGRKGPLKETGVAGARYYYDGRDGYTGIVAVNQTKGWMTYFVYVGNVGGNLTATEIIQSGSPMWTHGPVAPLSEMYLGDPSGDGTRYWVWVQKGRWTIKNKKLVPLQ